MKNLKLQLIFLALSGFYLSACKKQEHLVEPNTVFEAGYKKEIDIYEPGTFWIYTWQQYGWNGEILDSGFDTIRVNTRNDNPYRELSGTVYGSAYTNGASITDSVIVLMPQTKAVYPMYGYSIIRIDTTQIKEDNVLASFKQVSEGCTMQIQHLHSYNIPIETHVGNYLSISSTQRTFIGNDNGGCDSGYEKINYVPMLGEVYREISYPHYHNTGFTIAYKRQLFSYYIAH